MMNRVLLALASVENCFFFQLLCRWHHTSVNKNISCKENETCSILLFNGMAKQKKGMVFGNRSSKSMQATSVKLIL